MLFSEYDTIFLMKILVIKPSSLGDVIHALPFLKAVKDTFPDADIDWVISRNLKGILEGNPLINELILIDKDSWKKANKIPETFSEISGLRKFLKSKHYDLAVDLQGLLRSGLMASSASSASKIGFADAREGSRFFYDKKISVNRNAHAVDKCLEAAKAIGARVNDVSFPLHIDRTVKDNITTLIGSIDKYIVISPSARWATKRWPAGYFASLLSKVPVPCVITGSKGDRKIVQTIKDLVSPCNHRLSEGEYRGGGGRGAFPHKIVDLCGKTDLKGLTALIAGARAVVSNDSGPMHIAAALDVPVIALFGPTDPKKTGPYGWQKNRKLNVLSAGVPCSPCRKKRCREHICMDNLSVDRVFDALKEYL